jgi:nitrogen PTS system EIIA component
MEISGILTPEAVKVFGSVPSKKRIFQELSEIAAQAYGIPANVAFDALQDREILGATGVGHGVALPHARIEGATRVLGVFVRLEKPIEFESVDKLPVDLIFALFAPLEAGVDHLKALATVSRTLRDASICAKLRVNTDPYAIYAVLTENQRNKAA